MSRFVREFGCLLALSVFLAVPTLAQAEFLVDDFSAPAAGEVVHFLTPLIANPQLLEQPDPGIIGGERDLMIEVLGTPNPTSFIGEVGGGRALVFASSDPGTTAVFQYDGNDSGADTSMLVNSGLLGGMDLTVHGDAFALNFARIDGGGVPFTEIGVEVQSASGAATFAGSIPDMSGGPAFEIPFADFMGDLGVFVSADSIEFALNPNGAYDVDFTLNSIKIVPEPSTLALCTVGLMCLLGCWFRRRK